MRRIAIILITMLPVIAFAETIPHSNKRDNRVREATYIDGQVYRIYTSLIRATTIEFPPGESLIDVVSGDTEALKFTSISGGRVVAIKPIVKGINTNVMLYTNRRSYYLNVKESPKTTYFSVRFNGGYTIKETVMFDKKMVHPMEPWRYYGANIRNAITPTSVWDDGVYTYFEFYQTSPIPAIFKTFTGKEMTVNSTVLEEKIVRVSGISNYWVLRSGDMETVVKRMDPFQLVKEKDIHGG